MTVPTHPRYLDLLCRAPVPLGPEYENWPPVCCTELLGHGGKHTAHTLGDVDYSWPEVGNRWTRAGEWWAWPDDEIGHLA